jgi:hypothetical protein
MRLENKIGLVSILALGLAACGTTLGTDDAGSTYYPPEDAATLPPGPDTAVPPGPDTAVAPRLDTGVTPGNDAGTTPPVTDPYIWVVIQDTEQVACTTNGPGSDIDAVAKLDASSKPIGWGRIGTAKYTPNPAGYACDNVDCAGGNCKYAANSSTFSQADLVARTEGPADAVVNAATSDTGYFSLNAGTLSIQIGDVTGKGIGQELKSGDWIAVYEVDQTYIAAGAAPTSCSCLPEHFTVSLQSASGSKVLPLKPATYDALNAACTLTATSTDGCGTTVFGVP